MSRKSNEERINALDIENCRYALTMISKSVPFILALQSAEKSMKKKAEPEQAVLS